MSRDETRSVCLTVEFARRVASELRILRLCCRVAAL